jgi:hypothetical protein
MVSMGGVLTQALLDSFRARVGVELIERGGKAEDEAERLFAAPFVVVSHGAETKVISLMHGSSPAHHEQYGQEYIAEEIIAE